MMSSECIQWRLNTPLSSWSDGTLDEAVCFSIEETVLSDKDYSLARLLSLTASLASVLQIKQATSHTERFKLVLFHDNSFYFTAAMLAANISGVELILPASLQPEYIRSLALADVECWVSDEQALSLAANLSDQSAEFKVCGIESLLKSNDPTKILEASLLDVSLNPLVPVTLFTSGSSGAPLVIKKTFALLASEVKLLDALFGSSTLGRMYATVSHQHIYGLLFRLLWPLLSGRPFQDVSTQYPESMIASLINCASSHTYKPALISSPAQLKRWRNHSDFFSLTGCLACIVSSGGPLPDTDAKVIADDLSQPVLEIYGSTETGGIAWRKRSIDNNYALQWQVFDSISIDQSADGCLRVHSPFIDASLLSGKAYFQTQDKVTLLSNQQFHLLGRADRVVKLEEKRVSLDAMEACLKKHGNVASCRLLVLKETSKRDCLSAVVTLSSHGLASITSASKKQLVKTLKQHLSLSFETVLLPRKWRFVSELPVNQQSKVTYQLLADLFTQSPDYSSINMTKIPARVGLETDFASQEVIECTDNKTLVSIGLPEQDPFFAEHFDEIGVLPGVVQLDWAMQLCARWYDTSAFVGMRRLKFKSPLLQGDSILLSVERVKKIKDQLVQGKVQPTYLSKFEISKIIVNANGERALELCSAGQLVFEVKDTEMYSSNLHVVEAV